MNLVHGNTCSQTLANIIAIESSCILAFGEQLLLVCFKNNECIRLLGAILQQQLLNNCYDSIIPFTPTLALLIVIAIVLLVVASKLALAENATIRQLCFSSANNDHLSERVLIRIGIVIELLKLLKIFILFLNSSCSYTVS